MNFLGSFLSAIKPKTDDDVIDRLNYYFTCVIILVFSITISAKQYVGAPIQCWVPAQFTGAWEQYAENYCFVQNTYWLALNDPIPRDHAVRDARQLGYYQWVPFILAVEAIFFYVPCLIWRGLNWQSGLNVLNVIKMAADTENLALEPREKAVQAIVRHIEEAVDLQKDLSKMSRTRNFPVVHWLLSCGKAQGVYVTSLYLFTKFLYVFNVVAQFFTLNLFLGTNYTFWGWEILSDLAMGREWEESGHFPRVTLCDFEVRVLGNLHRYTIQCVLMINMFNEKIFLFLWWWFVLVALCTIYNLLFWLLTLSSKASHVACMTRFLRMTRDKITPDDKHIIGHFASEALRPDGILLLRLLSTHAGDLITSEIVEQMYTRYKERQPAIAKPWRSSADAKEKEALLGSRESDQKSPDEGGSSADAEFLEKYIDGEPYKRLATVV